MSKTKHKYNNEDEYGVDEVSQRRNEDRRKQKRIERALKTKNIEDLIELDDEGVDPLDLEHDEWFRKETEE